MELINDFLEYQSTFRSATIAPTMAENTHYAVALAAAYVAFVFAVPKFMANRQPIPLKWAFTYWNLLLSVFSIIGALVVVPKLLMYIYTDGLRASMCGDASLYPTGYSNTTIGFWVTAFILSKVPELLDTVFLVLQKKPVIFLHWFHHATVMLYCWHAYTNMVGVGWYFVAMNFTVHGVMYGYYFMMALSDRTRKMVRPYAQFITTIQIVQMLIGAAVTVMVRIYASGEGADSCPGYHEVNNQLGFAMYGVYFFLFAQLFYRLYMSPTATKKKLAAPAPAASGSDSPAAAAALGGEAASRSSRARASIAAKKE
jgi:hypothetical protein